MPTPLEQALLAAPRRIGTPQPLPSQDPTAPSTAKTVVEGGIDSILGMLGVGPETKSNLSGQLLSAALPLAGVGTGIKGLFSRVDRAAEELPATFHPNRALSMIGNKASKEEMDYRGLTGMLKDSGNAPLTKELVQRHLAENPLKVETTTLGERRPIQKSANGVERPVEDGHADPIPTKYSQYTLPGGQNYRESLVKLDKTAKYDWNPEVDSPYSREGYMRAKAIQDPTSFQSNHWDEPNVLVHSRYNERNLPGTGEVPKDLLSDWTPEEYQMNKGPKGRFLEEVQSDWHEQGRDKGYKTPADDEALQEALQRRSAAEEAYTQSSHFNDDDPRGQQAVEQLGIANGDVNRLRNLRDLKVPDAPFKDKWADLALKQHLLEVANRPDLEWLGWTPGEVQNKRYDLAQHVSELKYDPQEKKFWAYDPNGYETQMHENVTPQKLVDLIGKDAAARLITQPVDHQGFHSLSGENLSLGGEGMKDFYDRQLPDKMNKLLKPFGGKVEQTPIDTKQVHPKYGPSQVNAWIARLSPEMKDRIKKEGLPLLLALLARQQTQPNNEAK